MKKYFYTNGVDKFGPFSFDDLKNQNLTRETKIWYYGLDNWKYISEIEELNSITNSIPPRLNYDKKDEKQTFNTISSKIPDAPSKKRWKNLKLYGILTILLLVVIIFAYLIKNKQQSVLTYQKIVDSAYETDLDFNFYVDKFYRDVEVYGIFPKRPNTQIIKLAKFDYIENTTHLHGISYGSKNDDRIEIYINSSSWEKFNKPMRYYLMYHELAHDILNLDDLVDSPENEGKLMYPAIASYESKTMDDFIESTHKLFEEISAKQNK